MNRRMGFCALAKVTNCNSFPVVLYCMICCTAVHILHSFSTDPCKNVLNCRVEPLTRQPLKFVPLELCPLSDEPLCASDGRTYPSECAMRATGIQKGVTLRKIHAGQCTTLGKAEACCLKSVQPFQYRSQNILEIHLVMQGIKLLKCHDLYKGFFYAA